MNRTGKPNLKFIHNQKENNNNRKINNTEYRTLSEIYTFLSEIRKTPSKET